MFSRNLSEFNDLNVLGGQTYALASNLQAGVATNSIPTQMQIRSLAPNAAAVVNQLNANQMQQVRAAGLQQARVQGKELVSRRKEAYSEPCQASKMKLFAKIVNN